MKAAELARRLRTYDGWLPPAVADRLAEHGHLDQLRRLAERGDRCCADRLARALFERHEPEAAVRVLQPFVDTGWWQAVRVLVDEAVALLRPYAGDVQVLDWTGERRSCTSRRHRSVARRRLRAASSRTSVSQSPRWAIAR